MAHSSKSHDLNDAENTELSNARRNEPRNVHKYGREHAGVSKQVSGFRGNRGGYNPYYSNRNVRSQPGSNWSPPGRRDNRKVYCNPNVSRGSRTSRFNTRGISHNEKTLEEISQQDSTPILQHFSNAKHFEVFSKIDLKPDTIVTLIKCMRQICLAEFDVIKGQTLIRICKSNFLKVLKNYILDLHHTSDIKKQYNSLLWTDVNAFFKDLFIFCQTILEISPTTAMDEFRSLFDVVTMSIEGLQKYKSETFNEEVIKLFDEVKNKFSIALEDVRKTVLAVVPSGSTQNDQSLQPPETPPEDFRSIRIMPMKHDLFNKPSFLRPNIVNGAYHNVEHYLDVQFRLMREDFIAPLRDAISQYLKDDRKTKRRYGSVKFYHNVRVVNYSNTNDGVGIEICFNEKLYNKIESKQGKKAYNNKSSRGFLYGSLLLLTNNDFNRYIYCTVANSDDASYGMVTASLDPRLFSEDLFKGTFLMIQSDVYFPPYLHILRILKRPALVKSFPFEEYIIHAKTLQKPPGYLKDWPEDRPYTLFNGCHVVNEIWPNEKELGLDASQYNAYKMALTREFVIIQGPPGTGKTFIGLKLVETLLKNLYLNRHREEGNLSRYRFVKKGDNVCLEKYREEEKSPILIVCYTNHALDQFLEGLLPFTRSLVRVGGQSKSESLHSYNLNKQKTDSASSTENNKKLHSIAESLEHIRYALDIINSGVDVYDVTRDIEGIDLKKFFAEFCVPDYIPPLFNWLTNSDGVWYDDISYVNESEKYEDSDTELEEEKTRDFDDDDDAYNHRQQIRLRDGIEVDRSTIEHTVNFINVHKLKKLAFKIEEELNTSQEGDENIIWERRQENVTRFYMANILEKRLRRGNVGYPKNIALSNNNTAEDYTLEQRWALYWQWCKAAREKYTKILISEMEKFKEQKSVCDELEQANYLRCLRNADVVGVTTSGAARLQALLRSLKCPIVVVEEAAEVIETHVIASVTSHCNHLIMIGDHQQLRPITASYLLAKHYNLDISLFERMVKNGNHCLQLTVQHRMRPEISRLITPAIYPELIDHSSVHSYPPVLGVRKNVFFIDHTVHENKVEDSVSRLNEHEAHLALSLAKYLVQQGYRPSEITILATYSGQMFYLREAFKNYSLLTLEVEEDEWTRGEEEDGWGRRVSDRRRIKEENVQVMVLDNYQGQENKIIILSLVRSNSEGNIGFLAAVNRVCVALSRAREGFYMIGNMSNLRNKSPLWNDVFNELESQKAIGEYLELQCQMHRDVYTPVKSAEDFSKVAEGGCQNPCKRQLPCGHFCKKLCHKTDVDHREYQCREKCEKIICELNHKCEDLCYKNCVCKVIVSRTLPCSHEHRLPCSTKQYNCNVLLEDTLSFCGHKVKRLCYKKVEDVDCQEACEDRLPCGHACEIKCHKNPKKDPNHLEYVCRKPCAKLNKGCSLDHECQMRCHEECSMCTILVTKTLKCAHTMQVECHRDVESVTCPQKCKRSLPCGHHCQMKCKDECDPTKCLVKVTKVSAACGHEVQTVCGSNPENLQCPHKCNKTMSCGHECKGPCYMECDVKKCEELIDNIFESVCGHSYKIPCKYSRMGDIGRMLTVAYCNVPCDKILKGCEHKCSGTCGKCWAGTLHVPCGEPCDNILVCGHACKEPCRLECPPCRRKCEVRCGHSKCPKICGMPCVPCKERCKRSCRHGRCNKFCSYDCTIPPCSEACKRSLKCGHPCRGLCGEKCPDVCKICKPDDYPNIFFGEEDDENARFIQLADCSHIVEVNGMDKWMRGERDGMVRVGVCPHCKSRVVNTPRYIGLVKKAHRDIQVVKRKVLGKPKEIKDGRVRLLDEFQTLIHESLSTLSVKRDHNRKNHFISIFEQMMNKTLKQIKYECESLTDVNNYQIHLHVLQQISILIKEEYTSSCPFVQTMVKIILVNVKLCRNKVSEQQSEDFNNQLTKLNVLVLILDTEFLLKHQNVSIPQNQSCYQELMKIKSDVIFTTKLFDDRVVTEYKEILNTIRKSMKLSTITVTERTMIVKAMGLKQGHWYVCPNGHPYCITECGGATVVSKCPECKEAIGGTQHRLLDTNRVARFMDGATHGAWPGNYNIQDYDL